MKSTVLKRSQTNLKIREDLSVYEYPSFSEDVDIIYAELNGRHPSNGFIINKNSDETYLVYEGRGEIYLDGEVKKFEAGDIVPIKRGTKYFCVGENMKFYCAINPPWNVQQEQVISWVDMNSFIIDWRITSNCCNKCEYCYASTKLQQSPDDNVIIDKILQLGCRIVCISGGEPLIDIDRVSKIINRLYENGVKIFLSTTGINFLENKEKFENKIQKLSLSLDGFDEESNVLHGRTKGNFERVIKILEHYKKHKHNFSIKIGTTLTRKNMNINTIKNIYNVIKSYPVNMWKLYEFIPENRGADNYNLLKAKFGQMKKLKKDVNKEIKNPKIPFEILTRKSRNKAYFIIQPNGTAIIPVDINRKYTKDIVVGDLKTESINDIFLKWSKLAGRKQAVSNWQRRQLG